LLWHRIRLQQQAERVELEKARLLAD